MSMPIEFLSPISSDNFNVEVLPDNTYKIAFLKSHVTIKLTSDRSFMLMDDFYDSSYERKKLIGYIEFVLIARVPFNS